MMIRFTRLDSPLSGVETFTIGSSTYAIVTDQNSTYGGVQIIDSDPTDIVRTQKLKPIDLLEISI